VHTIHHKLHIRPRRLSLSLSSMTSEASHSRNNSKYNQRKQTNNHYLGRNHHNLYQYQFGHAFHGNYGYPHSQHGYKK